MRSLPIALPVLILAAILQSTIVTHFRFLQGGFDLVLVVVLAWNLAQRENDGPMWALIGGVLADLLSGGPMGAATLALVALSLLIALTEGRLYRGNWAVALLVSLVGTILYHLLYLAVLSLTGISVQWDDALTRVTLPSTILNLMLMMPTFQIAKWIANQIYPPPVELG